jgi:hypothetical protein
LAKKALQITDVVHSFMKESCLIDLFLANWDGVPKGLKPEKPETRKK